MFCKDDFRLPEIEFSIMKKKNSPIPNPNPNHIHKIALDLTQAKTALTVIQKLQEHDFEAYLVGGAVRDALLGITPKDFDVATNATPQEIQKLFKYSRIIGKRFPIVHVIMNRETIEVSTFRSGEVAQQNAQGRIMRDHSFGTVEQDAARRDFTCNSLYYDPNQQILLDFNQGLSHIQNRQLVMIGHALERYQEDPVRILRAIRLSSKLGFEIEEETANPIHLSNHLLRNEPNSRLFDEVLKMLGSGHAQACLKKLEDFGIHQSHSIFSLFQYYQEPNAQIALQKTDQRLQNQQSASMGFVLAALIWSPIEQNWQKAQNRGESPTQAMATAAKLLRETIESKWNIPMHFATTMRDIWTMQPLLLNRRGSKSFKLLSNPRFRAGYDFLLIRAEVDDSLKELADWWTQFYHADAETRQQMSEAIMQTEKNSSTSPKKRRRRRKPKNANPNSETHV